MAWSKVMLLAGLIGALLIDLAPSATAAERGRDACRRGDRLHIQDLDMTPDPLIQGQLIRAWRVQIRLEGNRACDTEIEIREGGEAVGRVRRTTLRSGVNQIEIEPNERYRFRAGEHCFRVVADLEGTRKEVDAARRFCAYQRPAWSMRESGDARRRDR
jgi:hypothetical protein